MQKENVVLMKEAREALSGKWGVAVGGYFLYMLVTCGVGAFHKAGGILGFLITGPMVLGMAAFSLTLARGKEASIAQLFSGFNEFIRALLAYLLMVVFILLWALLLIIPGIIAAFSYSQTFYILSEDKSISARDAIKKSKAMMMGNKKKLFYLSLRFLGWAILCVFTFGIGFLWLMPYVQVTMAKFYDDISKKPTEPVVA